MKFNRACRVRIAPYRSDNGWHSKEEYRHCDEVGLRQVSTFCSDTEVKDTALKTYMDIVNGGGQNIQVIEHGFGNDLQVVIYYTMEGEIK